MDVTYQQVFGVAIGDELTDGKPPAYFPCPAVQSLNKQLLAFPPFSTGGFLGGKGPLLRPGPTHEFNRHHAGLAVDIMLNPNNDQLVALGQQLVLAFWKLGSAMQWRGVIYQDITLDLNAAARTVARYTKVDHFNHIHVDWFNPGGVTWHKDISSVPVRFGAAVRQIPVTDPAHRIAEKISWPAEALNVFDTDPTIKSALAGVMARHAAGLTKIDLLAALGLGASTAEPVNDLVGTWDVTIGPWSGIFVFGTGGTVYWADSKVSARHPGTWSVVGNEVHWKFSDGDIRTFVASLPLLCARTKGTITPVGQGEFAMTKE